MPTCYSEPIRQRSWNIPPREWLKQAAIFGANVCREGLLTNRISAAICVPVRNEEAALPDLLEALRALRIDGVGLTLCLLFDDCIDGSEAIAKQFAPKLPFPILSQAHNGKGAASAGRARRAAMALGQHTIAAAPDAVLLTTDADSCPREDWVHAALRALAVADVAAGRIVRMNSERDPAQCRVERYFDCLHAYRRLVDPVPWDAAPGCHFGGGANLAIRADAYRLIGGFKPIASGEDARFLDDASRAGFRVRRDPSMVVTTSSRRVGRVHGGLATALETLASGVSPMVASPSAAIWQYELHAAARKTFAMLNDVSARETFGSMIELSADHILGVGRDCPNAEAFAMRIVPSRQGHDVLISLADAEAMLADFERGSWRGAA